MDCSTCNLGKSKILPFHIHDTLGTKCIDIVHSDVWGITPVISHTHYKYFVTFIEYRSQFKGMYLLQSKSEVFNRFKNYLAYIENQFSTRNISHKLQIFFQEKGIISQRSCPYTPQQNGIIERKNKHLLDTVRSLLLESSVPARFWSEALSVVVHLINRLPSTKLNNESPYFCLYGAQPGYTHLHTFGCVCFVHLLPNERTELTAKCAFLGYASNQKGFLSYDPNIKRIRVFPKCYFH